MVSKSLNSPTKITSGSNEKTATFVDSLYQSIIAAGTHKASSIAIAEAAKVIENTQRDINIALMNELSRIFTRMNIDTYAVLKAAGTKWNFLPFKPGLIITNLLTPATRAGIEFIKTDVLGAQNIIEATLTTSVNKVIALSTDKAAAPINLYGATKLCSDKLFVAANNIKGNKNILFSVIRYGNVMGSRGSVIPFFMNIKGKSFFPITDSRMTRFNISLFEATELVAWSIKNLKGGEILVPKIPSYRIIDVAHAVCDKTKKKFVGAALEGQKKRYSPVGSLRRCSSRGVL